MRFETFGKLHRSLLPVLVVALTSASARAGYIYDTYHSTGVSDSKKVLQVRPRVDATGQPTDEVEVRTLCAQSGGLRECGDTFVVKKDRLESVAALEQAQYQRLMDSIDNQHKKEKKTEENVQKSLTSVGVALAFPPAAPVAVPLFLFFEGRAISNRYGSQEKNDEASKKPDPRLDSMSASVIKKALSQDVAVSDYRRGDEIELLRSNLKDLFSNASNEQDLLSKNPSVFLGAGKPQELSVAPALSESTGSSSGSAF